MCAANDGAATTPSVNDLLRSLRAADAAAAADRPYEPPVLAPSMPASIRQLLGVPDTPSPPPRRRQSRLEPPQGPAPPPPPGPWPHRCRGCVDGLPGLARVPPPSSLAATCLRRLARNWRFHRGYDRYYLAALPTGLRVLLLSYVARYGPDDGVGYEGLKALLRPRDDMLDAFAGNGDFCRLDLAGSVGRSLSFQQLRDLVAPPGNAAQQESWEAAPSVPPALQPPLHSLKILSLADPPPGIQWSKLLAFALCVPTLTHLSLANWPAPSVAPNCNAAKAPPLTGFPPDQYPGATNFYSLSLDGDYSDAAMVLRRLSNALYCLEWLSLDGCDGWANALRWNTADAPGIDWKRSWGKVRVVSLRGGVLLPEDASKQDVLRYKSIILRALGVEDYVRRQRGWIAVEHDQWDRYDALCDLGPDTAFADLERMFLKMKLGRRAV